MNTTFPNLTTNELKTTIPAQAVETAGADLLTINFSPNQKLLWAKWHKPVSTAEYRQAVRMIVRSVAFLRAELVLIDISPIAALPDEDQRWTAAFLQEALSKTSIRRSARVLNIEGDQLEMMQKLMAQTGALPYELQLFNDFGKAEAWLLEGLGEHISEDGRIPIPLNINLKLLRSKATLLKERDKVTTQTSPAPLPTLTSIETDFVSISINLQSSTLTIRWKKTPQSREYRLGMLKAGRALKQHRLENVLLNNQRLGMLTLEDQGWLVNTSIGLLPETNLKKLAVVTAADSLQQMSSEVIGCKLKEARLPYTAHYFLSEEEAIEWLKGGEV